MNIKLRNILIGVVVAFVLIIILRVTKAFEYILWFLDKTGIYLVLFAVLILIGVGIYLIVYNKKVSHDGDIEAKAWAYAQEWWSEKMGMAEKLKLQDGLMKRGFYDSGQGMTELFIGFNVTKMNDNTRIIFVVATKPLSIAHFDNSVEIDEKQDPFLNFYPLPPSPVPHFDDNALKSKFAGPHSGLDNKPKIDKGKKKKKSDDEDSDD